MNKQEYVALKNKYAYKVGGWDELLRIYAFMEFDAALEEYDGNGKDAWNGGEQLFDASPADVECIMDEFIGRVEVLFSDVGTREMRNAIQAITGLVC